jgi:hypothetical protein
VFTAQVSVLIKISGLLFGAYQVRTPAGERSKCQGRAIAREASDSEDPGTRPGQSTWDVWTEVFLRVLQIPPVNIIPPWLSILICRLGDEQ